MTPPEIALKHYENAIKTKPELAEFFPSPEFTGEHTGGGCFALVARYPDTAIKIMSTDDGGVDYPTDDGYFLGFYADDEALEVVAFFHNGELEEWNPDALGDLLPKP